MGVIITFFAVIVIALSSCGGNSSSSGKEEVTGEVEQGKQSPEEMGEKISMLYSQALSEVVELLKVNPSADEVLAKITELKEKYVMELVELGKKREAMEDADRSKLDLTLKMGLRKSYSEQAYMEYSEAINAYAKNSELYNLLTDFNIITQYCNFELLKKQEPEEAQRLGIE